MVRCNALERSLNDYSQFLTEPGAAIVSLSKLLEEKLGASATSEEPTDPEAFMGKLKIDSQYFIQVVQYAQSMVSCQMWRLSNDGKMSDEVAEVFLAFAGHRKRLVTCASPLAPYGVQGDESCIVGLAIQIHDFVHSVGEGVINDVATTFESCFFSAHCSLGCRHFCCSFKHHRK